MEQKKLSKPVVRDITESLGKLPPQALDLEEAVLGALMIEKNAVIEVAGFLRADHFYRDTHQIIYDTIISLFAVSDPIDMRTVVTKLRKNGKLELVGGAYAIAELTSKVSSSSHIAYHARIIVEMSMKRSLIMMASRIHQDSFADTVDVFDVIEKSNIELQSILDNAINATSEKSIKDVAVEVVREQQGRQEGKHSGLDIGFPAVDSLLNGLGKTDLIIIAARPGMGKSAFSLQAAKNVASKGIPVGVFSLEMSSKQIVERLVIAETQIDSDSVKKGILNEADFVRFMHASGDLGKLPLYIDDTAFLSIIELRARTMRMKSKYGIQMLIVDYLQLIKAVSDSGSNNRDQEIGIITRTLKGMAKELEIPVIALSQLNRSVETRGGMKRPQLSDLRESGSIEQDADSVIFLYRPEYYKITTDENGYPTHGKCEVIVEKHRGGSTGTVNIKFIGKHTRFTEWITYTPDYVSGVKSPVADENTTDDTNPF